MSLFAEEGSDRDNYIAQWKEVAIEQMHLHAIPASITMAQAILESGNGKSMLSVKANNHFGIKCHGWDGPGVRKDDDKKNECFRKYKNGKESFDDHSLFLKKQRYAFLFEYDITDYKAWAKGLKKAGYATDPAYAKRLITLIEDNDLDKLDSMGPIASVARTKKSKARYEVRQDSEKAIAVIDVRLSREVHVHTNAIKYVKAKVGDTPDAIAQALDMAPWQIKKYNDLDSGHLYRGGEVVFIQPKKNKGKKANHIAISGESLADVSQLHGVKLKKLADYNLLSSEAQLTAGQKIVLRKPKK
jgi:LysM repeat protein